MWGSSIAFLAMLFFLACSAMVLLLLLPLLP
jgi:hypothetical protein